VIVYLSNAPSQKGEPIVLRDSISRMMADADHLSFLDHPEELDALLSLQEFMMNLSSDNLEESKQWVLQSPWVANGTSLRQLASSILVAARVRVMSIPLLASLLRFLCSSASEDNSLDEIRRLILSGIFRAVSYSKSFPNESAMFSLLFQCFREGIFDISDIIPRLRFMVKGLDSLRSSCWAFCYLAPELQKADKALYDKLLSSLRQGTSRTQFPQTFRKFSAKLPDFRKNNWRLLRKRRQYFSHKVTLLARIRADDIDGLRVAATSPSFNIETRILPTVYTPSNFLQGHPTLIHVAAFFGSINCFRFLLVNGADLRTTDHNFVTLPQFAVAGGNVEIVRLCQQYDLDFFGAIHTAITFHRNELFEWLAGSASPDFSVLDLSGQTLLHAACDSNNLYAVDTALRAGLDVNGQTFNQGTPLCIAVGRGFVDTVRYLLTVPTIDVNPRCRGGQTPFHLAAEHGDIVTAKYLLAHADVDVDAVCDTGMSALFSAITNDRLRFARFLLDLPGVDVNRRQSEGFTPLMASLLHERVRISKMLINDSRVDVNLSSGAHRTALWIAIKHRHFSAFKCLLKRPDIDLSGRSENGGPYLNAAVWKNDAAMVEMLLSKPGVDVNEPDGQGMTLLHNAATFDRRDVVRALLTSPTIDVNLRTAALSTALHIAAASGFAEIVQLLVDRSDTDVNAVATVWGTAMHTAVCNGHLDVVRILCTRTDIDLTVRCPEQDGVTSLYVAACLGKADIVMELLQCPALNVKDAVVLGKAPITSVIAQRSPEMLELIRQWADGKTSLSKKNTVNAVKKKRWFNK
jgi:ankyrin repeat protein